MKTYLCRKLHLAPTEFFMFLIGITIAMLNTALVFAKDAQIEWTSYSAIAGLIMVTIPIGMYYRLSGRSERIASALICTGGFILFSACLSLFNYLLLPIRGGTYDQLLVAVDAMIGFHWPDVMQWASGFPLVSIVLKAAYMSTMLQFALLIALLGFTGRLFELHKMITSVCITATFTICFWAVFPTMGPTYLFDLPAHVWQGIGSVVDANYGNDLRSVAANGPGLITPTEIRGLVAFPSYHAVLAFTAIYAVWTLPYVRWVFLLINLLILPAIFVHGGHHFVDLPAAFVMFLFGTVVAKAAVKRDYERYSMPIIAAA